MRIAVIGVGHVGLVTAAALAHLGHDVIGLDEDPAKLEALAAGATPFFEPGLFDLVKKGRTVGRLAFTGDIAHAMEGASVAFICVGTPSSPHGEANLRAVYRAAAAAATHATRELLIVQKSTVPVKTAERLKGLCHGVTRHRVRVASNPEFLREGQAVADSLHPDRILVGADDPEAHRVMRDVYGPIISRGVPYFATDIATAELAKHACNAFLAIKISYANALARLCESAGADVVSIADIMGADRRIGRSFLDAGIGYGGYCLPKDLAAFKAAAAGLGYDFRLLDQAMQINREALEAVLSKIRQAVWSLEGKRVVLLGLAFKAGTDDVRESPALLLARRLIEEGAEVVGYDPKANDTARGEVPGMFVSDDVYRAAEGADCLAVTTEWPEFRALELERLKGIVRLPIIVDARNLLDPEMATEAGFTYIPTGRPSRPRGPQCASW
ncbi:MAG: UDP-glucose/GDP-mannose dehydrogenase family protein [Actinomycetota bacterium]|nr:UDP-glucose/GDP-mannose dehydrogenase family protein [Actinomycetota bacterium]